MLSSLINVQRRAMSSAVGTLKKPKLRGHLGDSVKWQFLQAFVGGICASSLYYFGYSKPKLDKIRDFYATYDVDADFERMRRAGVFKCCPQKDSPFHQKLVQEMIEAQEEEDEE